MDVMNEASKLEASGKSIIHMEVGQPSSGAAKQALNKLNNTMLNENVGYTLALGLPELKQKISDLYKKRYNVFCEPERIIITSGSSAAFILAFTAFFDAGESVLVGEPGYPSYRNILKSLNLIPKLVTTSSEKRFQLSSKNIEESDEKGVLIANPSNPTGTSLDRNEFQSVIEAAREKKMILISDEIYHGINFHTGDSTAIEFDQNCIVINSFSKYFFLSGWRIGWMVVPRAEVRAIEKLAQNLYICPPHASQLLALYSMDIPDVFGNEVLKYKGNRDILISVLSKLGFREIIKPDGAFYIYANIKNFEISSDLFCQKLLVEAGVAITPGTDFDTKRGHSTVRFSYSCSQESVVEAVRRLTKWCNDYRIG